MANILRTDKQIEIIGALCEGAGVRSIERVTGVHRGTTIRLVVKIAISPIKAVRVAILQELKELRANADIEAEA